MWIKIAGVLLRNRIAFIIGILLITIFLGFQIRKVEMSYEYANLLPATDSAFLDYLDFHEKFGQEGNVMVFAIQDSDFYQLDKLNDWIRMCDSLKALHGIVALVDITHSFNLVKDTVQRKFDIRPIFPKHIQNGEEMDSLVHIIENLPFYDGMLFNKTKDIYGMMVSVSADVMNSPTRVGLVKKVVEITENFTGKHQLQMHYSGLPYIRVVNAENIKKEMYMFIVLSLLISTFILYLFFRSFRIIGFCLLIVLICVSWTVGVMGLFHIKITLLTAMLPPLLIVICIPNMVFMINKFHAEYDRHGNKIKGLQRMIEKIGNASFLSNLTTAAGFATFIVTSSRILVEFGITASVGITFVYLVCLVMIPCTFSFLPPPDNKQTKHLHNKFVTRCLEKVTRIITYHRNAVYITTCVVIALGFYGISLMKSTGYMVDDLKETDPIRQDLSFFEENFDGLMPLEIMVDFRKPNQAIQLSNLERLDKLSKELATDEDISKPVSLVEVIKFANQAFYNGNPVYYKLPTNLTKNFILKYASESTGNIGGQASSFVDSTLRHVRMSYRVKDIGTKRMQEKENKLYEIIGKIFPAKQYDVKVTGSSIIFFKGTQYLVRNLVTSLLLAIVLIAIFMAWMFRSKRMVFVALIPNLVPQIITASIMGYFDIPIKASTILVFSIAFGISVDGTIHYLAKYRQELQVSNRSIHTSAVLALKETGQSMIYNAIILFFGFGIFALSDFGGTVALGILVSITLLAAMFSNLFILPSLLLTLNTHTTNKRLKEPVFQIADP